MTHGLDKPSGKHCSDEELLLEVEIVQIEQMAFLRCLIKHHSLRRIYAEGLTPQGLSNYHEKIGVLRDMEKTHELRSTFLSKQGAAPFASGA